MMVGREPVGQSAAQMSLFDIPPDPPPAIPAKQARRLRDYQWAGAIPFILVHLLPFCAFYTGVNWQDWAVCFALYFIRMFGVTGVYHRYFAHRTYKTSRWFQFVLALFAMTSSQKGVLWWAAHHRDHHKYSDTERDPHSPVVWGLTHSHMGWLFDGTTETRYDRVKDIARYPELVALNKLWMLPPALTGLACLLFLGPSGLWIGFFFSTVLLYHGTFTINSLSHVFGSQRYDAGDDSRNNLLLALITMGEGWHNNHHHYQTSTRQGFFWWEIDMTYYILKMMSWVGLVWDIREPPARVYEPSEHIQKAA
jgi:stearoyl-CoA desaturase (delta-9 desaturase)